MAWQAGTIPGNNTSVTNNFCTIAKTTYYSALWDIAAFTPTQLSGFRYRISYDDDPAGSDWNYGFCFNSPTIKSVSCEAPSGLAVANITPSSANFQWLPIAGVTGFEYALNNSATGPNSGTETTVVKFAAIELTPSTVYYFHVRTNCGDTYSEWRTVQFTTLVQPPANDSCATAIAITAFPYTNAQDASAATNNAGFITACSGMNDGVWYSFVGDGADITVTCENVVGWDAELGIFTGSCGTFTCVGQKDSAGTGGTETYTITASTVGTVYYVNIGHYSGFTNSAEGPFSITVTSNFLSTPSFDEAGFSAYPNPVKDTLNLSYVNEISAVAVYNLLGQEVLVKSIGASQAAVDFSSLSAGAYLVKVVSGNTAKTIKVIKQ